MIEQFPSIGVFKTKFYNENGKTFILFYNLKKALDLVESGHTGCDWASNGVTE